jgi:choice-of-anchor B domain-containing protein
MRFNAERTRGASKEAAQLVKSMSTTLAVGLALLALPFSGSPADAQIVSAAHDDAEWEQDRQPPYAGAGWLESDGGSAAVDFPSSGIDLRSWISLSEFDPGTNAANDCWGYVAPSGREYALIGLSLGTAFVEVTDPGNAQIVDVIAGPTSSWRDIKTHQQFAYAVSEAGEGIQVFDLSQIDSGVVSLVNTITAGGRLQTHDLAINTESGRLYRVGGGGNSPVNGLRVYSLADPSTPAFLGEWHDRYCHDAQVVTWTDAPYVGVEVAFCYANDTTVSGNPGIEILDVSDPENISVIGSINLSLPPIFSHPAYYAHQGWLSPDRQYVYFNDEVDEAETGNPTTTRIIDVSDLSNPIQVATFTNGNPARDHNLYTKGELLFESNYRSGLRVFSASDPLAPIEIAYFDTYPDDDDANYNGLWSVYPYLPSGTIIGSDIERGLFVWTFAVAPVPALSARGSLATVLMIAILAIMTLGHRRPPGRTTLVIIAALAAVGFGCGPEEVSDPAPDRRLSQPAKPLENGAANLAEAVPTSVPQMRDRVRSAAIRSAAEARDDQGEPTTEEHASEQAELLSNLGSPDPEVRADAADWIDLDSDALERLISMLESDPDAEVRATIVDRLGEEESSSTLEALIIALRDPDPEVVLRAIEVLEFEAGAWLIPELERLLSHRDPEVAEAAEDAIDFLME